MYDKKILVSGCGLSWSGQERRTWVTILKSLGLKITDVGGPAVSNQWVLNNVILNLIPCPDIIIIQLTDIGKLDVEIDPNRELSLVKPDSIRNFTYKGVWPSSFSFEHPSKQLWREYLYSPGLEKQDIICKLLMLKSWCQQNLVKLHVLQGYPIEWSLEEKCLLNDILDPNDNLYSGYVDGIYYQYHDHANSVPCLPYQCQLAKKILKQLGLDYSDKINIIKQHSINCFQRTNNL